MRWSSTTSLTNLYWSSGIRGSDENGREQEEIEKVTIGQEETIKEIILTTYKQVLVALQLFVQHGTRILKRH